MFSKNTILYPPKPFFPNHPDLSAYIGEKFMRESSLLVFDYGIDGKKNVIKTTSSPFMNFTYYDFKTFTWTSKRLKLLISKDNTQIEAEDVTDYTQTSIVGFDRQANNIYDNIKFYFDGEKIITNYDFTNPDDQKLVSVEYYKITDNIKVKATLVNLTNGLSLYTPIVDQYTLIVSKQKVF